MRIFSLLFFTILFAAISLSAQEPIEVHIPDTTAGQGEKICIPLTVKEFNNIAAFSFGMRWNPAIVEFDTLNFTNPALNTGGITINYDLKDEGVLIFFWLSSYETPIDIPDDSTFLEVCFNAIGNIGDTTDVTLGSYKGTEIDFYDTSSVDFTIFDGSVTIVPTGDLEFNYSACESASGFDINVQVFGGDGPYSYQLTETETADATGQSDEFDITGLSSGNYKLEITDANGQMVEKDISLQSSANPGAAWVPNTCSSENPNGYIYLNSPLAGSSQIEWTYNDQSFYNVDTLKNLVGGEVRLTITDENNCKRRPRVYPIPDQGLKATATVVAAPSCNGDPGLVRIDITGGTSPYSIYNGGNTYNGPNTIPMNRTTETYNIRDINPDGCAVDLMVTASPVGGDEFTLNSGATTNINCGNEDDRRGQFRGNITNTSSGSNQFTSAELYFIDGTPVNGTRQMRNALTGAILARFLDAGEYEWRIEGECAGSDTTFSFTIEDLTSTPPSVDATITPIGCGPGDALGAISLTVFPANQEYTYDWSTRDSTATITDLDTGIYIVTVTDTLSKCSLEEEYTIQPGIVLSKIEGTIPCDGDTMINVGVTIKDEYESILWDSGENTEIISVNTPGYYPFTITPKDPACSPFRDSIHIASEAGGVSITGLNQVLVDECGNPEAIVIAYLSEPKADFGFSWDNGPVVLGENEYRVFDDEVHNLKVYKDNCVAIDTSFSYTFMNIIKIDSTVHDINCFGDNNGEITVDASGGGSNRFRYEFNGSGREDRFASYTDLAPGNYTVRVIDQTPPSGSPCPDVNLFFTITEPGPFTVAVDSSQVSQPECTGESNGSILLTTIGGNRGTKEIRYNFSGGAKRTNDLLLDSLKASNYQIRVEDSLGCIAETEYLLEDPDPVNFAIPPIQEPDCAGYTATVTISNATGGTEMNYQYSVDGGVPVPLGDPLDILAGTHDITVFDGNLCSVTNAITIREPAPIIIDFNQPDTVQVSLGENTDIAAQITADNPINDYIWTPVSADSLSSDNTLTFTAIDNVTIGLEVVDSRGCVGSNEIFVLVRKKRDVGIPNAFSPNGDGHNDLLTIIPGPSVRSIKKFQVYDRYGTLMWEESEISPAQAQITGWDGTYSGEPAMIDVYVALVKVEYIDGQVIQRITDVTLIK